VSSTDFGEALIKSYRELERDLATFVARNFHTSITTVMRRHSKSGARASVRGSLE
jgi:molybdenum-dependent DNA-binding transcriptional regulator ModE